MILKQNINTKVIAMPLAQPVRAAFASLIDDSRHPLEPLLRLSLRGRLGTKEWDKVITAARYLSDRISEIEGKGAGVFTPFSILTPEQKDSLNEAVFFQGSARRDAAAAAFKAISWDQRLTMFLFLNAAQLSSSNPMNSHYFDFHIYCPRGVSQDHAYLFKRDGFWHEQLFHLLLENSELLIGNMDESVGLLTSIGKTDSAPVSRRLPENTALCFELNRRAVAMNIVKRQVVYVPGPSPSVSPSSVLLEEGPSGVGSSDASVPKRPDVSPVLSRAALDQYEGEIEAYIGNLDSIDAASRPEPRRGVAESSSPLSRLLSGCGVRLSTYLENARKRLLTAMAQSFTAEECLVVSRYSCKAVSVSWMPKKLIKSHRERELRIDGRRIEGHVKFPVLLKNGEEVDEFKAGPDVFRVFSELNEWALPKIKVAVNFAYQKGTVEVLTAISSKPFTRDKNAAIQFCHGLMQMCFELKAADFVWLQQGLVCSELDREIDGKPLLTAIWEPLDAMITRIFKEKIINERSPVAPGSSEPLLGRDPYVVARNLSSEFKAAAKKTK